MTKKEQDFLLAANRNARQNLLWALDHFNALELAEAKKSVVFALRTLQQEPKKGVDESPIWVEEED